MSDPTTETTPPPVTMHREWGGPLHPAVNIKVNAPELSTLLPLSLGQVKDEGDTEFRDVTTDSGFTLKWIEAHLSEGERDSWWQAACEDGIEDAKSLAAEAFGSHAKVYTEGRSGGWLVVHGLDDVEDWDPADHATWVEFAKDVRALADDTPRRYLWLIHANVHEAWLEQVEELRGEVPADFPVRILPADDPAGDLVTCGACGRSWDDAEPTAYTPAPSGRCPFEAWHPEPPTAQEELSTARKAVIAATALLDAAVRRLLVEKVLAAYPTAAEVVLSGEYNEDGLLRCYIDKIHDIDHNVLGDRDAPDNGDAWEELTEEMDPVLCELAGLDDSYQGVTEIDIEG